MDWDSTRVGGPLVPRHNAGVEQRRTGRGRVVLAWLGVLATVTYLANPTFGLFELIPDNLPGIGNLDEAAAATLLVACARSLGLRRKERLARVEGGRLQSLGSQPATQSAPTDRKDTRN